EALGILPVNEVIALSYSTRKLYPHVKTIIEMGGEDSKLVLLHEGAVKEFSMNSVCAAGTGSFLDQQAERLKLSIEEFSELALKSEKPPRIAGRCSVFAKSDMIHLQQIATPMEDIVAGLCFAVARNYKGSICKNMELPRPISFLGGVAANKGVARGFKEVLPADDLLIPEHFAIMPAIGAVIKDMEQGIENIFDITKLENYINNLKDEGSIHKPLCSDKEEFEKRHKVSYDIHQLNGNEKVNAYLGIDIGSISTNLAAIDEEGRLLAKSYLMTSGRPIDAVRQGLDEIGKKIGDRVNILRVGTTGSGRYMIADFVGADIVKNEITAQARAAAEIDPDVDTIFEIGGQDSKYISIRDGVIVDFEMNKACAAGTGSFLEEQAEKLDMSVKNDFARTAFSSEKPCALGERCTVFMENSLLSRQQRGAPKEDLVSGLSYSIVQNYINRVVSDKKIGNKIFFQGGTAFNKAVVAAFEKYLDRHIIVPPHHDVTGAIGMAIIAKKQMVDNGSNPSLFKGFDLSRRQYTIKSFECNGCDNLCEINRVKIEGEEQPLFYGSRCEKYDVKRKNNGSNGQELPDLFAEREVFHAKSNCNYAMAFAGDRNGNGKKVKRIGIPRIFFFHDFLPFWSTLLWELGFEVVLSDSTNRQVISKGLESILAESCFPHKVAHGHIKDLLEKDVDAIFMPSFINFNPDSESLRSFACPYAQTMPYIANTAFGKEHFLVPIINMERGEGYIINEIYKSFRPFNISKGAIKNALKISEKNQKEFIDSIKKRGRQILKNIPERSIVITGRSYNAFDPGINLEIPKKLAYLGVFSIPMDYLPLETIDISQNWSNMYWRSGQSILKAAEIIRNNPRLYALYIGNFACGPDSFIQRFFQESMSGKPYLQIEIDEHSADAGVITRCEAFLDSINNIEEIQPGEMKKRSTASINKNTGNKIVFIPRMSDHAFALAAAFKTCGLDAEVMDTPVPDSVKLGRRYLSGKECYPCAITTGDMVKKALSDDFDSDRSVFFMPSGAGPCRFGQYNVLNRLVLDELGFSEVPIHSPNQDEAFYSDLGIVGKNFTKQAWRGIIATDLLMKCLHEIRPYEVNKGETDEVYKKYLFKIYEALVTNSSLMMDLINKMKKSFADIPRNNEQRPLIGIIGEIFVRHNSFANENIVRKVEKLGGEVWLAPLEEWIYYVNKMGLRKSMVRIRNSSISKKSINDIFKTMITTHVQKGIDKKFSAPFEGFLKTVHEPSTKQILSNAAPYLDDSFEGEAVLSMGKAVDYVKKGASGIISAMPFGCMPGTIVSALLKGIKKDWGIPTLSASYDGAEATCTGIQLEAFMHQATEYTVVNKS
ncbi:CoA protein activase, partial [bacterium]|nr:CoA protein activase [bacterium]